MNSSGTSAQAALDYLYGRINYEKASGGLPRGRELNLDRMRELLARSGDPQRRYPAIHIAGTKGKGSTATMIAQVLIAAGYRVGLYTSPHLDRLEERVQINGVSCTAEELSALANSIRPAVDSLDEEAVCGNELGPPTFFEITTAMAMLHFSQAAVDVAVLEVGLGGRLDSTNVCQPIVSVITSISFDHTRQLGDTLAEIASEKAGIIKTGIPVVCGVTEDEPRTVICQTATEQDAPIRLLGEDFSFKYRPPRDVELHEQHGSLEYTRSTAGHPKSQEFSIKMLGSHQATNAAIAVATLEELVSAGWQIEAEAIARGLAEATCPARIEVVSRQPTVILDTAHNVASIDAVIEVLDDSFAATRRTLIFAATKEKDVRGMLQRLLRRFDSIILTQYLDNPRAVPVSTLEQLAGEVLAESEFARPAITLCETPEAAWQTCESVMTPNELICITGSFFLAAEMRSMVMWPKPVASQGV